MCGVPRSVSEYPRFYSSTAPRRTSTCPTYGGAAPCGPSSRATIEPQRQGARLGTQPLRHPPVPAHIEVPAMAEHRQHQGQPSASAKHRRGKGRHARNQVAVDPRQPAPADVAYQRVDRRGAARPTRLTLPRRRRQLAAQQRRGLLARQPRQKRPAGGRRKQRQHAAYAQIHRHRAPGFFPAHHRGAVAAPDRQRRSLVGGITQPRERGSRHPHRFELRQAGQSQAQRKPAQLVVPAVRRLLRQSQSNQAHQVAMRLGRRHGRGRRQIAQHHRLPAVRQRVQQPARHLHRLHALPATRAWRAG